MLLTKNSAQTATSAVETRSKIIAVVRDTYFFAALSSLESSAIPAALTGRMNGDGADGADGWA